MKTLWRVDVYCVRQAMILTITSHYKTVSQPKSKALTVPLKLFIKVIIYNVQIYKYKSHDYDYD